MNHGWEKKKIDDVCVSKKDILRASVKFKTNDLIEYVDISSIDRDKHIITHTSNYVLKDAPSRAQQVIDKDDILLSLVRPNLKNIACVSLEDDNLVASSGFCVLRSTGLLSRFLFYIVTNDYFTEKLIAKCAGAAYPAVREEDVKSIFIPVPSMGIQQQIASELDKINELIEVKRSQLADLDLLAQSLFYEMFGDPINNPTGWKISKVSEIFETGSGGTPSKSVDEFWSSEDIPWIGSNMCQNKILYETDGKFISTLGLENSSAKLLEPDTILIALVGATIGKVALLKIPTSTNQNIGFIKPDKNIINPIFLFYTIQGLYSLFLEIGNGKFKMANLSFIRDLPIIIPPISLQNEFAMRIEAIEDQKKLIESSIADLQTLLASRMDYWFND